ncbi:hypothetical protein AB0C29_26605 [Actinoplanes sp. NPDC048791]|uniref:hypothetical protein n=1 Tax=Actinoplanes sp. NPDC048791 TaxID=3154623 RepID=UPI0033DD5C9D
MTTRDGQGNDQAALLGVALAAVISVSVADGSWEPIETIVGLVLLLVVAAFWNFQALKHGHAARVRRLLALTAVSSLCVCLVAAWPIDQVRPGHLSSWILPAVWATTFTIFLLAGIWWSRRPDGQERNTVNPPPDLPVPTHRSNEPATVAPMVEGANNAPESEHVLTPIQRIPEEVRADSRTATPPARLSDIPANPVRPPGLLRASGDDGGKVDDEPLRSIPDEPYSPGS